MLVSFYILTFNHERYISDAISAALRQMYSPLEIIISDDCSTDRTWEIIQSRIAGYQGPHRLIARRNTDNLGISAHINALWQVCSGEWIVASAGDDASVPDWVERIMVCVKARPDIKLHQSWLSETDSELNIQETTKKISKMAGRISGFICLICPRASRIKPFGRTGLPWPIRGMSLTFIVPWIAVSFSKMTSSIFAPNCWAFPPSCRSSIGIIQVRLPTAVQNSTLHYLRPGGCDDWSLTSTRRCRISRTSVWLRLPV